MGWFLKDVKEWIGRSDVKITANINTNLDTAIGKKWTTHFAKKLFYAVVDENQTKVSNS